MKTPYQQAGYKSKLHGDSYDTKFRLLRDTSPFKKGDVVVLCNDDGSHKPGFSRENENELVWLNLRYSDIEPIPDANEHETIDEVLRIVRAVCLGDKVRVGPYHDFYGAESNGRDNCISEAAHHVNTAVRWLDVTGKKYTLLSEDKSAKIAELEKQKAEIEKQIEELKNE